MLGVIRAEEELRAQCAGPLRSIRARVARIAAEASAASAEAIQARAYAEAQSSEPGFCLGTSTARLNSATSSPVCL